MRLLFLFVIFIVGIGFFLQTGIDLPYLNWMGRLAGDFVIRKNGALIHFPVTTALLFSMATLFLIKPRKSR